MPLAERITAARARLTEHARDEMTNLGLILESVRAIRNRNMNDAAKFEALNVTMSQILAAINLFESEE